MTNEILGLVPTMQSVALLSHNLPRKKKKGKKKGIIGQGVENIVGISLIGVTAKMI